MKFELYKDVRCKETGNTVTILEGKQRSDGRIVYLVEEDDEENGFDIKGYFEEELEALDE